MVRVEEIKKDYDPRIIQTTQRYFAPLHVHSPFHAFQRIKYSVFFTAKNIIYNDLSLSVASKTGYKDIPKTSKGHEVAPGTAPLPSCPFSCPKDLQAINFFSEIEKGELTFQQYQKLVVTK
ncbi:MAG TPA: hypothetical protein VFG54_03185 [Prolixibacteraceae bacterium]|nr:hypothetical protein [Prolixibacteraceae bacterium]